ncbi:metal-dependent hydrolase, partial [Acinetobacter baumannii]|nr:metal-dependent hydrolase [Acinetobacter baumannii]EKU9719101.1 metal-dependent hydrolase [Acinetobacter baumannii]HBC3620476.1 metal-dependent hydrolase [Acinetobacter baumannii]
MISTTVKKSLNKIKFYREIELPDFASKKSIPIRHLNIGFEGKEIDVEFYMNNQFATMFFATLSVFLTYGEDLVIETARHHREFIQDPVLKQRVTSLIGQEAIHSKLHNEYNDALKDVEYPVDLYRFLGENFFKYVFLKFPQPLKLSMMAGIEHFTAVLAEYMMKHEKNFYYSDDAKSRALWMWHMLEESEHKDIAYDVYQLLNGSYPLRASGFFLAFFTILGLIPATTLFIPVLRKPQEMLTRKFWKDARRGVGLIFGPKDGVFGSTIGQIFDYLRPDFHPNDHDTTEYL